MWAGVGKSGSPAPKPITGSPAAFRAFALASTARVADSAMAPTRVLRRTSRALEVMRGPSRWGWSRVTGGRRADTDSLGRGPAAIVARDESRAARNHHPRRAPA